MGEGGGNGRNFDWVATHVIGGVAHKWTRTGSFVCTRKVGVERGVVAPQTEREHRQYG